MGGVHIGAEEHVDGGVRGVIREGFDVDAREVFFRETVDDGDGVVEGGGDELTNGVLVVEGNFFADIGIRFGELVFDASEGEGAEIDDVDPGEVAELVAESALGGVRFEVETVSGHGVQHGERIFFGVDPMEAEAVAESFGEGVLPGAGLGLSDGGERGD